MESSKKKGMKIPSKILKVIKVVKVNKDPGSYLINNYVVDKYLAGVVESEKKKKNPRPLFSNIITPEFYKREVFGAMKNFECPVCVLKENQEITYESLLKEAVKSKTKPLNFLEALALTCNVAKNGILTEVGVSFIAPYEIKIDEGVATYWFMADRFENGEIRIFNERLNLDYTIGEKDRISLGRP